MSFDKYPKFVNLQQFQDYTINYLQGNQQSTFWHAGPLESDSELIKDKLIFINSNGFITIDGQADFCNEQIQQKSYLEGYIAKSVGMELIQWIQDRGLKYLAIDKNNKPFTNIQFVETNKKGKKFFNLTRQREVNKEWELYTNLFEHNNYEMEFANWPRLIKLLKQDDYMLLFIISPEYCIGLVEDVIIDFFNTRRSEFGRKQRKLRRKSRKRR